MGVELVEGQDLFVRDDFVFMRTTQGPQRVDVIYRRIDDDFLDPLVFRADSMLGVPGLMAAYRAGRVAHRQCARHRHRRRQIDLPLRARDDPLLPGRGAAARQCADADRCGEPDDLRLHAGAPRRAGGEGSARLGRLRHADRAAWPSRGERERLPRAHHRRPGEATSRSRRWRSPPARRSSTQGSRRGTSTCGRSCSRASEITIVPGGLTRVALREGSLVVNSSQGGGTKDTWVLEA